MCNLKTENYVSFNGFSEDLGQEDSLSDSSKELLHRRRGRCLNNRTFVTKTRVGTSKDDFFMITVNQRT